MGSEVSDDLVAALRELVANHGAEQVRKALSVATKRKRGRPRIDDLKFASPFIELEGLEWLLGADLTTRGRQAKMVRRILQISPSRQSLEGDRKRIEDKLRDYRVPASIILGLSKAINQAPLSLLIDKLGEALHLMPRLRPIISWIAEVIDQALLIHRSLIGEPDPGMSLRAIIDDRQAKRAIMDASEANQFRGLGQPPAQ